MEVLLNNFTPLGDDTILEAVKKFYGDKVDPTWWVAVAVRTVTGGEITNHLDEIIHIKVRYQEKGADDVLAFLKNGYIAFQVIDFDLEFADKPYVHKEEKSVSGIVWSSIRFL